MLFPTVAALATVASVIVPYCALRLPIPPIMIVAGPSWIASIGHGWLSVAAYFADDLNIQRLGVQLAVLTFVVAASLLPSVPTLVRRLIDRVPSRSSA